jgi:ketosteroid isomerase-like protein
MKRYRRHVLLALTLAIAACSPDSTGPTTSTRPVLSSANGEGEEASARAHLDLREEREGLLATDRAYAAAAAETNLVEALVAPLAPDVVFLGPGPGFAVGPAQARALLEANPNNALSKQVWTPIRVDVSSDATRGYTYGYATLTLPDGSEVPLKYVSYWARQSDGSWKIHGYKRVVRAPGPVSLTPPAGFETPDTKHRRYFPNTDPAIEVEAVKAADVAFSDLAQVEDISTAFARYAAPDGAQTGSPADATFRFGREEIAAGFAGFPAGSFSWAPEFADVAASGDLGMTIGFVYVEGAPVGKYFTVWQKQNNGDWLFVVD